MTLRTLNQIRRGLALCKSLDDLASLAIAALDYADPSHVDFWMCVMYGAQDRGMIPLSETIDLRNEHNQDILPTVRAVRNALARIKWKSRRQINLEPVL